jgi:hypothetical protein
LCLAFNGMTHRVRDLLDTFFNDFPAFCALTAGFTVSKATPKA